VGYRKVVFIALLEHEDQYQLSELIREQITPEFELVLIDKVTEGQLCTVLKAKHLIEPGESVLIAASDSYIESDIADELKQTTADGIISVIDLPGEQWSFAKIDSTGRVIEVAEKNRISDNASTGIYYFKDGSRFLFEAEQLVQHKETTRGEYYVMPVYNKLIQQEFTIRLSIASAMWDMGTPEAKLKFENYLHDANI
jgi:dTDP-glucose pyrophosphorylase